jgi:hypothetical protein
MFVNEIMTTAKEESDLIEIKDILKNIIDQIDERFEINSHNKPINDEPFLSSSSSKLIKKSKNPFKKFKTESNFIQDRPCFKLLRETNSKSCIKLCCECLNSFNSSNELENEQIDSLLLCRFIGWRKLIKYQNYDTITYEETGLLNLSDCNQSDSIHYDTENCNKPSIPNASSLFSERNAIDSVKILSGIGKEFDQLVLEEIEMRERFKNSKYSLYNLGF